jgi:hypothetical protein
MRMWVGIVCAVITILLWRWCVHADISRWWRLALFLPIRISLLGLMQARAQTCVALARSGTRNLDHGTEAVEDPRMLDMMRAQATRVRRQSLLVAVGITVLAVVLPR